MPYEARLYARPGKITTPEPVGLQLLRKASPRDSYFYVPARYDPAGPCPLALMLHGAGGHAHHGIEILQHLADGADLILVAPASTGHTWDVILDRMYDADVAMVDQSLEYIFNRYAADPAHVAIGGFSDGASYALSLGLTNGDLFNKVIAFSPGFVAPVVPHGKPSVFISHGDKDDVLPISNCSDRIVPMLKQAGYDVTYRVFNGGHTVPADVTQEAVEWFIH
jgi:phospholipase/carboxylesterase